MYRYTLLAAVTAATLVTGSFTRSQAETLSARGQTLQVSEKAVNGLVCRDKWQKLKDKPNKSAAELQALEYGNQYFMKVCKREVASKTN